MLHTQTPPGEDPWQTTRVVKTLWPPQAGTVKLRQTYGWQLVCVRYRRDIGNSYRYTTVELVVDHAQIRHRPARPAEMVEIRLARVGAELAAQIQAVGGKWDSQKRVWKLGRKAAKGLKLLVKSDSRVLVK